jgi:hypothetical protein
MIPDKRSTETGPFPLELTITGIIVIDNHLIIQSEDNNRWLYRVWEITTKKLAYKGWSLGVYIYDEDDAIFFRYRSHPQSIVLSVDDYKEIFQRDRVNLSLCNINFGLTIPRNIKINRTLYFAHQQEICHPILLLLCIRERHNKNTTLMNRNSVFIGLYDIIERICRLFWTDNRNPAFNVPFEIIEMIYSFMWTEFKF